MINSMIEDRTTNSININQKVFHLYCETLLKEYGHNAGQVSLIISNDEEISDLKIKYFNEYLFTDVITFNLEEENEPIEGEIYISWDRICENAIKYKVTTSLEIKRVIIHGLLHLLGFNDQSIQEKTIMTQLEDKFIGIIPEPILI